jgi:hypothetical protein
MSPTLGGRRLKRHGVSNRPAPVPARGFRLPALRLATMQRAIGVVRDPGSPDLKLCRGKSGNARRCSRYAAMNRSAHSAATAPRATHKRSRHLQLKDTEPHTVCGSRSGTVPGHVHFPGVGGVRRDQGQGVRATWAGHLSAPAPSPTMSRSTATTFIPSGRKSVMRHVCPANSRTHRARRARSAPR